MEIDVTCRAQGEGPEEPWAFTVGERRVQVLEVLDRWPGADHQYFKVQGDDGARYILRHDLEILVWQLEVYELPDDATPRSPER